ncbi:hypothetical protein Droror1_Dr00023340 [Drosera rotundifolia]
MKVSLVTARGISYLHKWEKIVHDNIKASNRLLRDFGSVTTACGFGLNGLFGGPNVTGRVVGYGAPELYDSHKVTYKSDVYSFGVLLLELLTGKAPNQAALRDEGRADHRVI